MEKTLKTFDGYPLPFGVRRNRVGHNFSIFSKHAEAIKLKLYFMHNNGEVHETVCLDPKHNRTGDVWHILIQGLPDFFFYAYVVQGPWAPYKGHRFDDSLELIDPYARGISGLETWNRRKPGKKTLAIFSDSEYNWEGDKPLNRELSDTIIYELHVRGFTASKTSGVNYPGTFKGLIEKIDYLKKLGITSVELMPIHEFDEIDCKYSNPKTGEKLVNYWGYSSISFFALKSAFADCPSRNGVVNEFRDLVKAFHKNGIEVIVDVVFNHTAEGGSDRPTINFKGLENSVYYLLDDSYEYLNFSGCGNTTNCNHPVVRKMILDSLHYFVTEMHVDGFRFDLASILSRDEKGNVMPNPPLLEAIAKDPVLSRSKIIAEAWDAAGLYQVGSFPASQRWAEWNGRYRDLVRRFCTGEAGLSGEMATRISGSEDLYGHSQRNPFHSINFITSHDGFTMMDLVSYEKKHNIENGEMNRDGNDVNFSMNFGVEGETRDEKIIAKRMKQIRNFATILMLSQGTPMILAGDEFGNSQEGNNNAWCQDNRLSWLDWDLLEKNSELFQFWKTLVQFRRQHPALRRSSFFTGNINPFSNIPDISWHNTSAYQPDFGSDKRSLAFLVDGREGSQIIDDMIYVALNFEEALLTFELPELEPERQWFQALSTSHPASFIEGREEALRMNQTGVRVEAFSIVVLLKHLDG